MYRIIVGLISLICMTAVSFAGDFFTDHQKNYKKYPKNAQEAYMTKADLEWIRPGYQIEILDISIPEDMKPLVEFKIKDDLNQPLDRAGVETLGSCSLSFILAVFDGATRDFTSYSSRSVTSSISGNTATQATTDSGGTITDLAMGHGTYKFGTALPSGYDRTKTHTLAVYGTRNLTAIIGKNYYSNVTFDFRPDGAPVTAAYSAMVTATCNACHQDLALHGGQRKDVKLCTTCHSPQSTDPDTGNTVDMAVMIHKIHRGENLPSVEAGIPYQIIGYRDSVHDYSHVALPMDIRNCATCHTGSSDWLFHPSRQACGSCHDNINWETGANHPAGPQLDDQICALCHIPDSGNDFDASIMGAHTIGEKSRLLSGLNSEILSLENTSPGMSPTVTFRITNGDGSVVDPASLNRLNILLAGPTTDYAGYLSEAALTASFNGDTATYTFTGIIPEDTMGTWTASADVYRFVLLKEGTPKEIQVREAAANPVFNFTVTDQGPVARREVVDIDKCNQCHNRLALHGGQRMVIGECVMCHNPNQDDSPVRPENMFPARSVHFKYMIHRIHKGEELDKDYTIYGYGGSAHNYNEVVYPGDLRNCEACHYPGSYSPPMPQGTLPTPTPYDAYSPMMPAAAACISCHDSETAALHAYVNTAPFGEACASCHGADREFSVEKVHAH